MLNHTEKNYDEMTREELEQELREAFLDTDTIDEPLNDELEKMQETLNRKWPLAYLYTPEESWERFRENHAEFFQSAASASDRPETEKAEKPHESELKERNGSQANTVRLRSVSALVRKVIIAAVIVVLLTGAVLAADSLGLVAWIRGWSDNPERYAQTGSGSPGPIKEALQDLGIDDPVYPAWLPSNYILTETLISKDPLLLYELYTKADRYVSITITPISAANTAIYPQGKWLQEKNQPGKPAHYIFSNDESITVVWYTENYFTSISSNITAGAMERIIESVYTGQTKGEN